MKNLAFLFFACSAILLAFSCKDKDDDATTTPIPATDYFPLTAGSYWIYNWVKIDTLGNETPQVRMDTVTVVGDTVVNGLNYSIVEGTVFGGGVRHIYRDSSGYLVEAAGGTAEFSVSLNIALGNDTTWIGDMPAFWTSESMDVEPASVTVPAGTFESCLVKIQTIYPLEFDIPAGNRIYPYHYAKGVGLVKYRTSFLSSFDYLEARLSDYHIK